MIRVIIIDFDDTITDNRCLDYQAFKLPCKKLGLLTPSKKKIEILRKKDYSAEDILRRNNETDENIIKKFLDKRIRFLKSI